jgi:hypothetical protein
MDENIAEKKQRELTPLQKERRKSRELARENRKLLTKLEGAEQIANQSKDFLQFKELTDEMLLLGGFQSSASIGAQKVTICRRNGELHISFDPADGYERVEVVVFLKQMISLCEEAIENEDKYQEIKSRLAPLRLMVLTASSCLEPAE